MSDQYQAPIHINLRTMLNAGQPESKAFCVCNKDGEYAEIVFAANRSAAILKSECYREEGDYIGTRATREKRFDHFATQGFVPKYELLKAGWWFECRGYKRDPRRRCCKHLTADDEPTIIDEKVYCSADCLPLV